MSVSIYYTARRARALSSEERERVASLVEAANTRRKSPAWESFCIYDPADPTEPDVVFEGATRLPADAEESWEAVSLWAGLLSEVRRALADCSWHVTVDDQELDWDDDAAVFRLSSSS